MTETLLALYIRPIIERKRFVQFETRGVQCWPDFLNDRGEPYGPGDWQDVSNVPIIQLGSPDRPCAHMLDRLSEHGDHVPEWRTDVDTTHPRHFGALFAYSNGLVNQFLAVLNPKSAITKVMDTGAPLTGNVPFTVGLEDLGNLAYMAAGVALDSGRAIIVSTRFLAEQAPAYLPRRRASELPEFLELAANNLGQLLSDPGTGSSGGRA